MAEPTGESPRFRRHQKVVARLDMPGIPAGTEGRIMYEAGFSWYRYRVQFVNGVERGGLDHRHLMDRAEWQESQAERQRAEELEERRREAEELRRQVIEARRAEEEAAAS